MTATNNILDIKPISHESKVSALVKEIERIAYNYGAGVKLPKVRDLAKSFKVSIATLDRALHILQESDIIERRHGVGIFVSNNLGIKTIGLIYDRNIFDDTASPFPRILTEAAIQTANEHNEKLRIYLDVPSHIKGWLGHEDFINDIHNNKLDGVLYCGSRKTESIKELMNFSLPFVQMGDSAANVPYYVKSDMNAAFQMGIDALINSGCSNIAMLTGYGSVRCYNSGFHEDINIYNDIVKSYSSTKTAFTLLNPEISVDSVLNLESTGYNTIYKLIDNDSFPYDGIFVTNDMMARGVLHAFSEFNINVKENTRLSTQSNRYSQVLALAPSGIILIENDPHVIAESMLKLLNSVMTGKQKEPYGIQVKPVLRIHEKLTPAII